MLPNPKKLESEKSSPPCCEPSTQPARIVHTARRRRGLRHWKTCWMKRSFFCRSWKRPLAPALSPSEGERENRRQSLGERNIKGRARRCNEKPLTPALSPSEGERENRRQSL